MSFRVRIPLPGRWRAAELKAALKAVEALSGEVGDLRSEIDDLRMENDLLAHSVLIDVHTGLANAAAFELDHLQLNARRRRSDQPYSILLGQIDHGDSGDSATPEDNDARLLAVAEVFKASVRQGDRAYCCDQNRLAVLLAGSDLKQAVAAGERFRSRVENAGIVDCSNPLGVVTVTVGVIEAGYRHEAAKDVFVEVEALVSEGGAAGSNQLLWPH